MSEIVSPNKRNLILKSTDFKLMNTIVSRPYMIHMLMKKNRIRESERTQIYSNVIQVKYFLASLKFFSIILHR